MKGLSIGYVLTMALFLAVSVRDAKGEDLPKTEEAAQPVAVEKASPVIKAEEVSPAPGAEPAATGPTAEEIEKAKADELEKAQAEELARAQAEERRIRLEEIEKAKTEVYRLREMEMEEKPITQAIHIRGMAPDKARIEESLALKIDDMADTLLRTMREANSSDLFIATFVDMDRMNRSNAFGRYMTEALMEKMHKLGFNVVELRASERIMAQPSVGMHVLDVQPGEIGNYRADTVLSGTYKKAGDALEVHAKIVSHVTQKVMAAASFALTVDKDNVFVQDLFESPLGRSSITTGKAEKGK